MSIRSDVQQGKDWLKSWPQRWFSVQEVQREANLSIGTPALAGKFRLARARKELESRTREGKTYKEYHYNSDYVSQERPKTSVKAPPVYFYTLKGICQPSPYFGSVAEALAHCTKHGAKPIGVYTGSHEAPILVEPEAK